MVLGLGGRECISLGLMGNRPPSVKDLLVITPVKDKEKKKG